MEYFTVLIVTSCTLILGSLALAGYVVYQFVKHVQGESARVSILAQSAFIGMKAESATEVVDAQARVKQHDMGLESLKDAYAQEAGIAATIEEDNTPKLANTQDGRQIDLRDYEVM